MVYEHIIPFIEKEGRGKIISNILSMLLMESEEKIKEMII